MNGLYVIAGASGAIGRRICYNVLQQGGTPILVGRNADKLMAVNEEVLNGKCPIIPNIDFSNPTEAGDQLATELKGETLRGLACKWICCGSVDKCWW
jgi:short-subunit dehydrogenase